MNNKNAKFNNHSISPFEKGGRKVPRGPRPFTGLGGIFLLLCFFASLLLFSCGGGSGNIPADKQTGGVGSIKAIVTGSKSFNPNISHGLITQYKVTITADDMATPIEAVFEGTAESGVIEGVPEGENRKITVEAINSNEAKIREGETEGLEVKSDNVTETEVKMESVPVFANLSSGNVIPNTRFKAVVFSEPGDAVSIEDAYDGATLPLLDIATTSTDIQPDTSSGIANISPPLLPAGEHKFTVKNARTGRLSEVTVRLIDGTKLKPAPLFSASSNAPTRLGGAFTQPNTNIVTTY